MLYGAPNYLLQKIQRVQNAAARLIFQESKFSHATPRLRSLHWLPVTQRIQFKLLLIIFKAIHGPAPSYISDLISVRRTGRYNLRSSYSLFLNFSSKRSSATLGDRSFHVAAPTLWNSLPENIRNIKTLGCSKKAIKTLLFQKAFYQ